MPKDAPAIDQIRAHRSFLRKRDQASDSGLDYSLTRKASEILAAKGPPTLSGALRRKAGDRYSE